MASDVPPQGSETTSLRRRFHVEEILLVLLVVLSVGGIAVTDLSTRADFRYWLFMVALFAGASLFGTWSRGRRQGTSISGVLIRQALHWIALAVAIYLVSLLQDTGRINNESAGFVALLALTLTTLLAGVHFDWIFGVLGVILVVTVVFAALLEQFLWLLVILAVGAVVGVILWRNRGS